MLRRLNGIHVDPDVVLVTCDIESLYTSIYHDQGVRASRSFLTMSDYDNGMIEFILTLLEFMLTHNYFLFKDRLFLQLQGTAMGASCAPAYANLFLGLWEREIVQETPGYDAALLWSRYIDDVFFLWQDTIPALENFLACLNQNTRNIRLTWKYSLTNVEFLDIMITKGSDGHLSTDLFRKSTAVNALLHASSAHHPNTIRAIPTGQFLRTRRICSSDKQFEQQAGVLTQRFLERGYQYNTIQRGYERAKKTSRDSLLIMLFISVWNW
ncbi:uncharacterized protein LOC121004741 [Bufo bufo]|uniref:uncharacterized protein LOC121004741 n=1 Tax=Bufo bufo TaxID=8384 RepID=UPI001ABE8649|nr:uncharacterized protein LOC121004741 [Bufo bufo]